VKPLGREKEGDTMGLDDVSNDSLVPTQAKIRIVAFPFNQNRTRIIQMSTQWCRVLLSKYEYREFTHDLYLKIVKNNRKIETFEDMKMLANLFNTPDDNFVQSSRFLVAQYPKGPQLQITNLPLIARFLGLEQLGRKLQDEEAPAPHAAAQQGYVRGTLLRQRETTGYVLEKQRELEEKQQLERDRRR
jgi:hypothetical protein